MDRYQIGVDIGGTGVKMGLVGAGGEILRRAAFPTGPSRPWRDVGDEIAAAALSLLEAQGAPPAACDGIGIGAPGMIDHTAGTVRFAANLNWEDAPLVAYLREKLGLPARLANDANCAVLGEATAGAAKGRRHVVMLTLGTGIGGGVIADGRLQEGGAAGGMELGHVALVMGGALCTCGRRGCVEAYASATALIRMAREAMTAHPQSVLARLCGGDPSAMNGRIPFIAARESDAAALSVVNEYIRNVGESIVNFVNIWRPGIFLLGGGIANEGAPLLDPLNAYIKGRCFAGARGAVPPIVRAAMGNDAGIVGAAMLAVNGISQPI